MGKNLPTVYFDARHLYYIPQYLPVIETLKSNGVDCTLILHREDEYLDQVKQNEMESKEYNHVFVNSYQEAFELYLNKQPDWIVFGNVPKIDTQLRNQLTSKFALMQHGIGPKACYYDVSEYPFDVRFVEGDVRLKRLESIYPDSTFVDTGYAKLDPIFNDESNSLSVADYGLATDKKTVLYAPTFFPSSIDKFSEDLPLELKDYNLIIKPHFFSYINSKYQSHRNLFKQWAKYDNVYIADVGEYNLIPFMQVSDIMLSDTSSAIFEFAAMDKPLIWCNFLETRWTYRGIFKFRLKNRLDPDLEIFNELCARADSPKELPKLIKGELANPSRLKGQRFNITNTMVGKTDGQCSKRISDYIWSSLNSSE